MRQLRYFSHSPFCRKVRLVIGEKKIRVEPVLQRPWEHDVSLRSLPLLTEENGTTVTDARAIAEYLDESHAAPPLMPADPAARATARRWINHFDEGVWRDVTARPSEPPNTACLTSPSG